MPTSTTACPRCSKPMPAGSGFCRRCGLELSATPGRPGSVGRGLAPEHRPPAAQDVHVFQFGWIVVLAIVVIAIGAVVVTRVIRTSTPSVVLRPSPPAIATPVIPPVKAPPPLPPPPPFRRHLPNDLPPPGTISADRDFRGRLLTQNRFIMEKLPGAIFAGAHFTQVTFEKAELPGADFRNAEFLQTSLAGADLNGARFDGASFSQSQFTALDTSAAFEPTRVREDGITERVPPPRLPARNAGKASFRNARINDTDFGGVDLSNANFSDAVFTMARLTDANLSGASFRGARLGITDFRGAKLDNANFYHADLTDARNLTDAQLSTALTDETTRLPRR